MGQRWVAKCRWVVTVRSVIVLGSVLWGLADSGQPSLLEGGNFVCRVFCLSPETCWNEEPNRKLKVKMEAAKVLFHCLIYSRESLFTFYFILFKSVLFSSTMILKISFNFNYRLRTEKIYKIEL